MHMLCVDKYKTIIQLVLKQTHFDNSGKKKALMRPQEEITPIQTTDGFQICRLWTIASSRDRMVNICDAQCSLSICYRPMKNLTVGSRWQNASHNFSIRRVWSLTLAWRNTPTIWQIRTLINPLRCHKNILTTFTSVRKLAGHMACLVDGVMLGHLL